MIHGGTGIGVTGPLAKPMLDVVENARVGGIQKWIRGEHGLDQCPLLGQLLLDSP